MRMVSFRSTRNSQIVLDDSSLPSHRADFFSSGFKQHMHFSSEFIQPGDALDTAGMSSSKRWGTCQPP